MPAVQLVKLQAPRVGGLSLRVRLEAEIDRLIALLDALDGDCDLEVSKEDEDGGDENLALAGKRPA
ncbi:MAG: hypothetical protein IPK28_15005 [Devosia sp.]|nr:hypothetical protein [Devosia sp.]